jgi:hypothetical protein
MCFLRAGKYIQGSQHPTPYRPIGISMSKKNKKKKKSWCVLKKIAIFAATK